MSWSLLIDHRIPTSFAVYAGILRWSAETSISNTTQFPCSSLCFGF